MAGRNLHPSILREYDIRGIVNTTLNADDFEAIGRGFACEIRERTGKADPTICVGRDGRLSSPELEAALVKGLTGAGANVVRTGLGPTPMLYFSTNIIECDAGIMVTGSHNPSDQNGLKMVVAGHSFFGADIQALGKRVAEGRIESGDRKNSTGSVRDERVLERYVERLLKDSKSGKKLKVAWDPGNGAAGEALELLIKTLPGTHVVINGKIDGTFPAHHPDPTVEENLEQLKELVAREKCDLGVAFDGDGDRIGVVDSQGRVLWGDQILVVLAREILSRRPGLPIVADVKASKVLFDEVAKAGGQPVMWKTGHSLIKTKMKEIHAPIAGEMSGHIFFADGYYGYDDALYAAVRLLAILEISHASLAEMRDGLPQMFNTPEIRFDCPDERKFDVVKEVKQRLGSLPGIKVQDTDGVRVDSNDGWWLLRASNTQAVLVARCESETREGLKRLAETLAGQLRASQIEPPADFV
jgi:phosphomannomutase